MASLSKEPLTTFSAVLFARQAAEINEEVERSGLNRSVVLRRLVDRGLEAERNDSLHESQPADEQQVAA